MPARRTVAPPPATARVFWSGRSQAVRLPKEFRVAGSLLSIHREGDRIVLEPPVIELDARGWPCGFWENPPHAGEDFELGDRSEPAERADLLAPPVKRPR